MRFPFRSVAFTVGLILLGGACVGPLLAQATAGEKTEDQAHEKPVMCFAPGTPDEYVEAKTREFSQGFDPLLQNSDPMGFRLSTRWSETATDGPGLVQGDPTTITWSYVPDGTNIPGFVGEGASPSQLHAWMNAIYGDFATWHALYVDVFERWGELTGNTYIYEPSDDGAAFAGAPGVVGVRGDVRIGAHPIDGNFGILAYNFFPDTGEMVLDAFDSFYNSIGSDSIRLRNVLSHEHGHGLGISHVCPINQTKNMEPFLTIAFDGPQHDDILAGQRGYGDPFEPNDDTTKPSDLGEAFGVLERASIDGVSDEDFWSFDVNGSDEADVSVTMDPVGFEYLEGPQNSNGSCSSGTLVNSEDEVDIFLEVLDTDGVTVLAATDANPAGIEETLAEVLLPVPGTYFIRLGTAGADNTVQLYDLDVFVDRRPVPELGGPYSAECVAPEISVGLDASGSFDPDGGSVTYQWSVSGCAGAFFDNDTSVTPLLTVPTDAGCPQVCDLGLDVMDDEGNVKSGAGTVTISDTQSPTILSFSGVSENECYFADPTPTIEATDTCDPNPSNSPFVTDEPDTDPFDPACDSRSMQAQSADNCGNTATGCAGGSPCPVPYFVNPNDCDSDSIPDCVACDFAFEMGCYASNCSKLGFGTGNADGKLNVQGSIGPNDCPVGSTPFEDVQSGERVRVVLDTFVAFDQPFGSFQRSGTRRVWKYRNGPVSMELNLESKKWKLTDRASDITTGDVDNSDGVLHSLAVGQHLGEETLSMDENAKGMSHCRKGKSVIKCSKD